MNNFTLEDPSFNETRESTFLNEAILAIKEKDVNAFRTATTKLKTYTDFDKWKINMFTLIMNKIEEQGDEYNPL